MKLLFENEFCKIVNNFGLLIRIDKILNTSMTVTSYFNSSGVLVRI